VKKLHFGPKVHVSSPSHGTHLETYSYYENVPMVPNTTILQLYCNLCNYIATIFSNIGEWSNATILQLMQLYCNLCNYMQFMQLYCNNFVCNYMQLCNYETCNFNNFMELMQLYATLCNYIATICNYQKTCIGTITYLLVSTSVGTTK
jgi:hypothetical protein